MFNNIVFLLGIALIWETTAQEPSEGVFVVNVKGTDRADVSFWNTHCSKIPEDAAHVKIVMGSVVDYFKPITGSTFCQMLTSYTRHQWSPDGENWEIPKYHSPGHLGGSVHNWPKDGRKYLSFWGSKSRTGGCCHDTKSSGAAWKQSFDLYYEMVLPYWLHRGTGRCPEEKNFGHESSAHGTLQECRDKCEEYHESYFTLWMDGETTKCGCYTDCDTLDTSVPGAESYEILSVTVRAELERNTQNLNTCTSAKDSCTENLATKGNELTTCTTAKALCDTNLATKENELTTCTTAKALCDTNLATSENGLTEMTANRGLWRDRFEQVQKFEDAIVHHSDRALEKFPDQAAVGNVMGECNKGSIPSFMDRLIFLGIGTGLGAGLYALMNRAFAKKSGDEYNSLVEI